MTIESDQLRTGRMRVVALWEHISKLNHRSKLITNDVIQTYFGNYKKKSRLVHAKNC
jgi:hypothetical protein